MIKLFFLFLFCPFVFQENEPILIQRAGYEGVIFNQENFVYPSQKHAKRFIPTIAEIEAIESTLYRSVQKILQNDRKKITNKCNILSNISKYKRQYIGYFEKGHKMVFISFLITDSNNWKKSFIQVEGGGCNYFQISYDINEEEVSHININAPE